MCGIDHSTFGVLSAADVERFATDGVVGPVTLMAPTVMQALLVRLREVLRTRGTAPTPPPAASRGRLSELLPSTHAGGPVPYIECRHLDARPVYELCTHPLLLEAARSLYGPDLLVWRSTFITKAVGGPEFTWHQDWGGVYAPSAQYGLEPPLLFTAWIALTEATPDNGCLRFLPAERRVIPGVPHTSGRSATLVLPEGTVDESRVVSMPLRPGQCTIFSDRAIHSSAPNTSRSERLGLSVRFTLPIVRVRPHFPGHACILASGRATLNVNRLALPPP